MTSEHRPQPGDAPLWKRVAHGLGFPSRTETALGGGGSLGWPHPEGSIEDAPDEADGDRDDATGVGHDGASSRAEATASTELSTEMGHASGRPAPVVDAPSDDDVSRETGASNPSGAGAGELPAVDDGERGREDGGADRVDDVGDVSLSGDVSRETTQPDDDDAVGSPPKGHVSRETSPALDDTPLMRAVVQETRQKHALDARRLPRPTKTRILTVANQKGGVGKTTTTVNVAAALALAGLSVLVVDLDPQGNASTALGVPHHSEVTSIYDVLVDTTPLEAIVQPCPDVAGLLCAPATIDLAGSEIELVSLVARETRLRRAITAYLAGREERIDYVLIDCPPSLGLLTVNAFVAADEVFIPIQCEYYALEGLSQLLKNIEMIKTHLNPGLHVSTILLTMYDGRTRLSAQVAEEVRTHFGAETLDATVPRSVRVSEAPSHGQTVITYDPMSTGALAYRQAAAELADRGAGATTPSATAAASTAAGTAATSDRKDSR